MASTTTSGPPPSIPTIPPPTPTPNSSTAASAGSGSNGSGTGQPITSPTRFNVWSIRRDKQYPGIVDKAKAIHNYIWSTEVSPPSEGLFIVVGDDVFLFEGIRKRLYKIDGKDVQFQSLLLTKYGLIPNEKLTSLVVSTLKAYGLAFGRERQIRRFVHFSKRTGCLYISRYDGTVWKLDGNEIEIVSNGTGVVFADDDEGIGCTDPVIGPHGILGPALVDDLQFVPETASGMTPDQQKLALLIWIHAIAFPDLLPTKPLLIIEGQRGSGKTSSLQRIMKALHGYAMPRTVGRKDEDDFGVTMMKTPLLLLDNTDNFLEWLQDTLCTYATSGGWVRRKLFTDTSTFTIHPQTFIGIATKNPVTFKRDDVADRSIILRLEGREGKSAFKPLNMIMQKLMEDRPEIFGEWLWRLNEIVAEIRSGALEQAQSQAHRMADWAAMAHVIGKAMRIPPEEVDGMLNAIQGERDELITEGDPLTDLLDYWLENRTNVGKWVSANDLHKELSEIAEKSHRKFYKSPAVLGQKLRDKAVGRHFVVDKQQQHGGIMLYAFQRKAEDDTIVLGQGN